MSKSYGNTIEIFAEGKPLRKTVMSIVTDSTPVEAPRTLNGAMSSPCTACSPRRKRNPHWRRATGPAGLGYGDVKGMLLQKIEEYFAPARHKRKELAAKPEEAEEVLRQGAGRARAEAQQTMALVRQAVGMKPHPVA